MVIVWVLVYWLCFVLVDELIGNFDVRYVLEVLDLLRCCMYEVGVVCLLVMYLEVVV